LNTTACVVNNLYYVICRRLFEDHDLPCDMVTITK